MSHICSHCDRVLKSRIGLISHERKCARDLKKIMKDAPEEANIETVPEKQTIVDKIFKKKDEPEKQPEVTEEKYLGMLQQAWSNVHDGDMRAIIISYRTKYNTRPVNELLLELCDFMKDGEQKVVFRNMIANL